MRPQGIIVAALRQSAHDLVLKLKAVLLQGLYKLLVVLLYHSDGHRQLGELGVKAIDGMAQYPVLAVEVEKSYEAYCNQYHKAYDRGVDYRLGWEII